MEGLFFRFYIRSNQRHAGRRVWEWLLDQGMRLEIRGGSAFEAAGGFGRHHTLHEARPVEFTDASTVEVDFIATPEEGQRLLEVLRQEGLRLFYACVPATFGVINPDLADPSPISDGT